MCLVGAFLGSYFKFVLYHTVEGHYVCTDTVVEYGRSGSIALTRIIISKVTTKIFDNFLEAG
jgi:hypothetical protein